MLSYEEAAKRLKKHQKKNAAKTRLEWVQKLPAKLRPAGFVAVGRKLDGKPIKRWGLDPGDKEAGEILSNLSTAERRKLFRGLFGKLADHVELGWQALDKAPYGGPYQSIPFRSGSGAEPESRMQWLRGLAHGVGEYDEDIVWFATWHSHLGCLYGPNMPGLYAAAIDAGDATSEQLLQLFKDAANGVHEIAGMDSHIPLALMSTANEDAWAFVEKMLLAAQRQEGLRQSILEAVDEAHPIAFQRMLKLILDENLIRFSSVVRAVDCWFGLRWDSVSTGVVKRAVQQVYTFLTDPRSAKTALKGSDAEEIYMALWSMAFSNVENTLAPAKKLLKHEDVAIRFATAVFLVRTEFDAAAKLLYSVLDDEDMRVVMIALTACDDDWSNDLFEKMEPLIDRVPDKEKKLEPLVWPWMEIAVSKREVSSYLLSHLGKRPISRIFPYLRHLDPYGRRLVAGVLGKRKLLDDDSRTVLFSLLKDASADVRENALQGVSKLKLRIEDREVLENFLTRKAPDLRRGILTILGSATSDQLHASAQRLLDSTNAHQRLGGLELLRTAVEGERDVERCLESVRAFQSSRKKLSEHERMQVEAVLGAAERPLSFDDALGLMDPAKLTLAPPPVAKKVKVATPAAIGILKDLDALIHKHRKREVTYKRYDEEVTEQLGNIRWGFPTPDEEKTLKQDFRQIPLREIWEQWFLDRPKALRDKDGLELLRAYLLAGEDFGPPDKKQSKWKMDVYRKVHGDIWCPKLRFSEIIRDILQWFVRLSPSELACDFYLDAFEAELAAIPLQQRVKWEKEWSWSDEKGPKGLRPLADWENWRQWCSFLPFVEAWGEAANSVAWTEEHTVRAFWLRHWFHRPSKIETGKLVDIEAAGSGHGIDTGSFALVYSRGLVNDHDAYDHFLGSCGAGFNGLGLITEKRPAKWLKQNKKLHAIGEKCRDRVLEIELGRGDQPTVATTAAMAIRSVPGAANVFAILRALGKTSLHRTYSYSNESKAVVLSELLRRTYPLPGDTPEAFAGAAGDDKVSQQRLIQLALFAPQWATYVAESIGWDGLEEAVWWIHAHTRDDHWHIDEDARAELEKSISERTSLASQDLIDGAVDVAWFKRVHETLKKAKWETILAETRYASGGTGHKRAEVFADAMLGRLKKTEMVKRIKDKRHQDTVRSLGLLPLARGKSRDKDLLDRYRILQEFVRTSRQFGSQRQTSEKRAAAIGQDNLARTAGYADPIRLQWAMEAREIEDMVDGKLVATVGETEVSLEIGSWGEISVTTIKNGKTLKNIPPALRKNKAVKNLTERRTLLKRQASRSKKSLEEMMCRGDEFLGSELQELIAHPLLSPMLRSLVLIGDSGTMGYCEKDGRMLRDHSGKSEVIGKTEKLRIAHPADFLKSKSWSKWQRDCLASKRIQPIKQIFRELYPLTAAEKKDKGDIQRYSGHQINPRQAMALFGTRNWIAAPEEGVSKTFHSAQITAFVAFQESYYSPADVEGLTIDSIRFFDRKNGKLIAPAKVPSRLFSEVMRDVDLVVSVAHRGGVDPEASASTVEMRRQLLSETTAVLGLKNVTTAGTHVSIRGQHAEYSVHLGSAVAHVNPGGALFIVPVHGQHRGRIFLPFADDDPKTAEVMSKVLLLARDNEIKDPSILQQIRSLKSK